MRKIFGDHRAMKSYQSSLIRKVCQQAGDVTIPNEDFRMCHNLFQVESFEKIIRAIAATCAKNRFHFFSHKHFLELTRPALDRSGKIDVLLEYGIEIKGLVSKLAKLIASGL